MPKGVANKQNTPEFKKKAIETMMHEKLSKVKAIYYQAQPASGETVSK